MKPIQAKDFLELVAVIRGESEQGMDTFVITLKDSSDTKHLCLIGCKPNYTKQIEKAFRRMIVVQLLKGEKNEESSMAETPPELPAGEGGEAAPI